MQIPPTQAAGYTQGPEFMDPTKRQVTEIIERLKTSADAIDKVIMDFHFNPAMSRDAVKKFLEEQFKHAKEDLSNLGVLRDKAPYIDGEEFERASNTMRTIMTTDIDKFLDPDADTFNRFIAIIQEFKTEINTLRDGIITP